MDLVLLRIYNGTSKKSYNVSILILMDLVLLLIFSPYRDIFILEVSILILMDLVLLLSVFGLFTAFHR